MSNNLQFVISIDFKGKNEVEKLLSEVGKKHSMAVNVDTSQVRASLEKMKSPIQNFKENITQSFAKFGLAMGGVTSAINLVKGAFTELVQASNVQEAAVTDLNAALRNTGINADVVSPKLQAYASQLQNVTIYGDEAILSGTAMAQNIGKFAAEDLPAVQKAAIGLAAAYKMDLNTAFQLIGRAAKGQTGTLSRYGIVLDTTKSKEEQFSELLEKGAENFSIAKEQASDGAGALQQYANIVGDLKETLGDLIKTALVPVVKFLSQGIKAASGFFRSLTETPLETTIRELEELGAAAEDIIELKKLMWRQELADVNAELEKAGIDYENIKDVTAEIKDNNEKLITLKKREAEFNDISQLTYTKIKNIYLELGYAEEDAVQKANIWKEMEHEKGKAANMVLREVRAGTSELETQNRKLVEYSDLLIQREALERKINQTIKERPKQESGDTFTPQIDMEGISGKAAIIRKKIADAFDMSGMNENIGSALGEAFGQATTTVSDWIFNIQDKLAGGFSEIDWNTMLSGLGAALQAQLEKANQYVGALKNLFSNLSEYRLQKKNQELRKEEQAEIRKIQKSKKTEEEKEKAIAKIKEKYAQKRVQAEAAERRKMKPILIAEAIANTAVAITKALPNLVLAGIAAATGAIQIATIKEQKFASGGLFRGYGGPKDDANLIRVSNGEYIVNAEATKRFFPLLNAINFGKYAVGGLVRGSLPAISFPTPAFANGGVVSGGSSSYRDETGGIWREIHNTLQAINMNLIEKKFEVNTIVETTDPETRIRQDEIIKQEMLDNNDDLED